MLNRLKSISFLVLFLALLPATVLAHQPRIVESRITDVPDPEVSKAYYGRLTGEPDVYVIRANAPFDLYVGVLVPDIEGQKKDVSAAIIKDGDTDHPLAVLEGIGFDWQRFFEEFGRDTYWQGPEYKAHVEAGIYEIRVWSSNNDSKYSLAIGEAEAFGPSEILRAYITIPQIKSAFFGKPAYTAFLTPFLGVPLVLLFFVFLSAGVWFWRRSKKAR